MAIVTNTIALSLSLSLSLSFCCRFFTPLYPQFTVAASVRTVVHAGADIITVSGQNNFHPHSAQSPSLCHRHFRTYRLTIPSLPLSNTVAITFVCITIILTTLSPPLATPVHPGPHQSLLSSTSSSPPRPSTSPCLHCRRPLSSPTVVAHWRTHQQRRVTVRNALASLCTSLAPH